jgi:aminoglycoside 6'-N-acetyltransferase I
MRSALWPDEPEGELALEIDGFLEDAERHILSAAFVCEESSGETTGFLELFLRNYAEGCSGMTPYVEAWYVCPDARRRGVGRALMDAAAAWARANGFVELDSDTELENEASQLAHRENGFEEVERIVIFRKAL